MIERNRQAYFVDSTLRARLLAGAGRSASHQRDTESTQRGGAAAGVRFADGHDGVRRDRGGVVSTATVVAAPGFAVVAFTHW